MSSLKYRLSILLTHEDLNPNQFYVKTGLANGFLDKVGTRLNRSTEEKIREAFPNLNMNWLKTGEGDMIKSSSNAVAVNSPNVKMIPLVSQYAQAGYLCGFGDIQYIETLPTIPTVVDHEPHGNYIAFEVKGDSMYNGTDESLNEGDILICREVSKTYWGNKLHINKWDFVIVHKEEGVLVKRIIDHDVDTGLIKLHSLNNFYADFTLSLKDVSQLFNVVQIVRSRRR